MFPDILHAHAIAQHVLLAIEAQAIAQYIMRSSIVQRNYCCRVVHICAHRHICLYHFKPVLVARRVCRGAHTSIFICKAATWRCEPLSLQLKLPPKFTKRFSHSVHVRQATRHEYSTHQLECNAETGCRNMTSVSNDLKDVRYSGKRRNITEV